MSPRKSVPATRDGLLEAANQLMLAKGFTATSVEEICREAGVTKGSFFYYFRSKEELGKTVSEYYWQTMWGLIEQAPSRTLADPLERIYGFIDYFIEVAGNPTVKQGCLLGNFAQELADTYPDIRDVCARWFDQWARELQKDLDAANGKYGPGDSLDTKGLANYIIAVIEGSWLLGKAYQDSAVNVRNLGHLKRYIGTVFSKKG